MTRNMYQLLENIEEDEGKTINTLISADVLTTNYIVKKAIESNNLYILCNVALYVQNLSDNDIKTISYLIINSQDCDLIISYITNVYDIPLAAGINIIIEKGTARHLHRLALEIKDTKLSPELKNNYIEVLSQAIVSRQDPAYIFLFTRDLLTFLTENSINILIEALIETGNVEYMYHFIKDIESSSEHKLALAAAIIESKNEKYIQKLKKLPNIPDNLEELIEREELKNQNKDEQMTNLNALIKINNTASITFNADIYRKLFIEDKIEYQEIEEEINQKKKVLTKQPGQGMRTKPQFPGERKLKK